jgi:hypothetical protein
LAVLMAVGCAGSSTPVPQEERAPATAASLRLFCAISLEAPERWQATLAANDVRGVDCIPPDGGEVFAFGFAHDGWWLQLDVARPTLVVGAPHPFDGQAALLALDCWEWDGSVTVDEDDAAGWALRLDARCGDDAQKAIVGSFRGEF